MMRALAAGLVLGLTLALAPSAFARPALCPDPPRLAFAQPCAVDAPAQVPAQQPSDRPDPWLGRDKALHAAGSFLLTLSGQYVLTSKLGASEGAAWPLAAGATLSLGLAKEIMDSRRERAPHFSWRDLAADAAGTALAVVVILL